MRRWKITKLLPLIFIFAAPAGNIFANGFMLPDQDAFATARGEAFAATANNPSAIYYNPAGMAQLDGDSLRGGVYGIYLDPTFKPPAGSANSGTTYHSSDQYAAVPQIFYVHSLTNLPLSFGLGIYAPFGGSMNWGQNTGFRQVAISASLKYITIAPAVAWKVSPTLSVGAGAMINYVHMETSQGFQQTQSPFKDFFDFNGDGWSAGYNAGILWQPVKQLSFGLNFRSSANVTLNGQTHYQNPLLIPNSHSSANMSMNFPWTIVPGISYRPTEKWNLEVDANYTDWSRLGAFDLHQQNPPNSNPDTPVRFDWRGSWIYEFGATRYFDDGWHVSGGYAFNENSVPDKYYTPWAADLDRHFFSVGGGFNGKVFDFDAAFQFGYGPSHTVTGSNPSAQPGQNIVQRADGTYGFTSAALMLTAGVHF